MADEDSPVTLDQRCPVEGAPLARVATRLTWGMRDSLAESGGNRPGPGLCARPRD